MSNLFCPDLEPVWRESFRVLRPGGRLLAGFMNPDVYIFDADASENRGELIVRHALPYADAVASEPPASANGSGARTRHWSTATR